MAAFSIKTKDQSKAREKPRVYFTCHPEDISGPFEKLCNDILNIHDCTIYYTKDMTMVIPEADRDLELSRFNLFVVPVTLHLLSTGSRAMDQDIPYALQKNIPVLPVMMETGLEHQYSCQETLRHLHYLNSSSSDLTEIPYETKLKNYLRDVLISDELAQSVREAFDARFFLSYRKKDRYHANELIQLIHREERYRSIAIWFDEFLKPGESFQKNIDSVIANSKLFTLVVTPNVLEDNNYVMTTEYPSAQKYDRTILTVEMEDTQWTSLSMKFQGIPRCLKRNDKNFDSDLRKFIDDLKIEYRDSQGKKYLIGRAYLEGIDVEVNRQYAEQYIREAAEAGDLQAMETMQIMFTEGIATQRDAQKSLQWAKRVYRSTLRRYGERDIMTQRSLHRLGSAYARTGDHSVALHITEREFALLEKSKMVTHPDALISLNELVTEYIKRGNPDRALKMAQRCYDLHCQLPPQDRRSTMISLDNLTVANTRLGQHQTALWWKEEACSLRREVFGANHPATQIALKELDAYRAKWGQFQRTAGIRKMELDSQIQRPRLKLRQHGLSKDLRYSAKTPGKIGKQSLIKDIDPSKK